MNLTVLKTQQRSQSKVNRNLTFNSVSMCHYDDYDYYECYY